MSPASVPAHAHCEQCGKTIAEGDKFCSVECKQAFQERVKKRKRMIYVTYGVILLLMALFFVQSSLSGG